MNFKKLLKLSNTMNNFQKLESDLKDSMLNQNAERVSALRMLKTALERQQKTSNKELTDEDFQQVLSSSIKKVKESIEMFKTGNRQDLVDKEQSQLSVLESYQPKQMTEEELTPFIDKVFTDNPNAKNAGMLMGTFMKANPELKNKFDSQLLKSMIEKRFNG